MKIISNFTDYYDYVQQYGLDDNIVFKRINQHHFKVNDKNWNQFTSLEARIQLPEELSKTLSQFYRAKANKSLGCLRPLMNSGTGIYKIGDQYSVPQVIAVINGNYYVSNVLVSQGKNFPGEFGYQISRRAVTLEELYDIIKDKNNKHLSRYDSDILGKCENFKEYREYHNKNHNRYYYTILDDNEKINEREFLISIHKEIKSPIFFIFPDYCGRNAFIQTDLPLQYFKFQDIIDITPEKLYQEISYCIGNVINNNNEPPIQITDKVKIEQHGFDNKISFRHRK